MMTAESTACKIDLPLKIAAARWVAWQAGCNKNTLRDPGLLKDLL